MSLQAQLLENAQRYDAILGSLLPKFTEEIRSEADHAVQGEIHINDGRFVAIGRESNLAGAAQRTAQNQLDYL